MTACCRYIHVSNQINDLLYTSVRLQVHHSQQRIARNAKHRANCNDGIHNVVALQLCL